MKYPDHADERSYKFFSSYYVGVGGNEDGGKFSTHIDTRNEDLKPSKTYNGRHCVYCGHHAYAIQPSRLGFEITGYFCVCKNAMDEIETTEKIQILQEEFEAACQALLNSAPKPSIDIKRKLIEKELKNDYNLDQVMKALRIA